jgi:hypothetical protein
VGKTAGSRINLRSSTSVYAELKHCLWEINIAHVSHWGISDLEVAEYVSVNACNSGFDFLSL